MSHHGDQPIPEELMRRFFDSNKTAKEFADDLKAGATGQFPEGKLTEEDEGEIRIAIGHTPGKVVMDFGEKPIKWIGFNPVQARQIAMMLMEHADECLIVKA